MIEKENEAYSAFTARHFGKEPLCHEIQTHFIRAARFRASVCRCRRALAASVQIVLPEETVPGGSRAQLTVTTDVPGFLTLTLDGPSGSVTLCENQEVHTADNTLIFTVSDEDGAPLDVGAYTVNGELIDQFGQTAASLSGQLTVGVPTAQMADEADSDEVPADETPADAKQSAHRLPSPPRQACRRSNVRGQRCGIRRFDCDRHGRRRL